MLIDCVIIDDNLTYNPNIGQLMITIISNIPNIIPDMKIETPFFDA